MFWHVLGLPGQRETFHDSSQQAVNSLRACVLASLRFDHTERNQLCQKFQMLGNFDSEFQKTLWELLELLSSLLASSSSGLEMLKDFAGVDVSSPSAACYWLKSQHKKELLIS